MQLDSGMSIPVPTFRTVFSRPAITQVFPVIATVGMFCIMIAEVVLIYLFTVLRWKKVDTPAGARVV